MQPTQIHDVVATEFSHVNDYILSQLKSEIPLIEQIGYYIISNGGKRLRPLLVLLAARASQPESLSEGAQTNAIKMASIVNLSTPLLYCMMTW